MRETRADTVQATVLALGLHVLLFAIAFLGIWWTRNTAPVSAAGPVIEAELVSPDALSPAMQRVLRERPDPVEPAPAEPEPQPVERVEIPPFQPVPEPVPQDIPDPQPVPQERIPEPDTVEQDRASAQAIADREAAEREQEERRRQEQIDRGLRVVVEDEAERGEGGILRRPRKRERDRSARIHEMPFRRRCNREPRRQAIDYERPREEGDIAVEVGCRNGERVGAPVPVAEGEED